LQGALETTVPSTHAIIALLGSLPLLVLPFAATDANANYRFAFLFLLPCLWGAYRFRRQLRLAPFHFALFAAALVLHNLGALGFYSKRFAGLYFDTYVHLYFGLVGGLILERALRLGAELRGASKCATVILFLLGLAALHELMEFGSTLVLGEQGMYVMNDAVDPFDTHKDMLNGLLGALLSLCASSLYLRRVRPAEAPA
jgi:uncharacterized membrane protein YjdF